MSLISQASTLTKSEFEQLFRQHFLPLQRMATQYVHDADTAQDICQKVFIRLWEKRQALNPQMGIKSYLYTAVKNRCLNFIRDHKKFRSSILDLDCGDIDLFIEQPDHVGLDDLKKDIADALQQLPEKCRKVFMMSRYNHMKYQEIAEALDISQKTVEAHMTKAMKILRQALKAYLSLYFILCMESFFLSSPICLVSFL